MSALAAKSSSCEDQTAVMVYGIPKDTKVLAQCPGRAVKEPTEVSDLVDGKYSAIWGCLPCKYKVYILSASGKNNNTYGPCFPRVGKNSVIGWAKLSCSSD